MKDRKNKLGSFVPLQRPLLRSLAFLSLSNAAKVAYTYFLYDKKSSHQDEVVLTFSQAKNFKVCQSQSTFTKIKRELVQYGLLDPLDGGGLNAPAIFKVSNRWNRYGNEDFKDLKYKPGFSSKFFKDAMANPEKRQRIIQARHGVS